MLLPVAGMSHFSVTISCGVLRNLVLSATSQVVRRIALNVFIANLCAKSLASVVYYVIIKGLMFYSETSN